MTALIDLYAKMLIGTFSFIGPSFSLLIPLFYPAILKSKEKLRDSLPILIRLAAEDQENHLSELQQKIRENKYETRLLNPKRQVIRIFFSLFLAIVFVLFYYFQKSDYWSDESILNKIFRIITLAVSVFCFSYCLRVLWQIFCTIIRIKQEETTQPSQKLAPNPTK